MRMALALDVAISITESNDSALPDGISKALRQDALLHLRYLRSAALRANRDEAFAPQQPAAEPS